MPISRYEPKTITEAPVASPSKPSVKFTPLDAPAIIMLAHTTNRMRPPTVPNAAKSTDVSRTKDTAVLAGLRKSSAGNCRARTAKMTATDVCPANFSHDRKPRLRCLEILM